MPGIDPGIHDELRRKGDYLDFALPLGLVGCRVKPGNDK
jgi:hypothetical protein